jgi:hypothetical protein
MNDTQHDLQQAIDRILAGGATFLDEAAFQAALAAALGSMERELRATFAAPMHPARKPPAAAIAALGCGSPPKVLAPEGKDPCARAAKLDLLWRRGTEAIPIELKYVTARKSDVYGYAFLKDLHRLERITGAGACASLAALRFCVFVTTEPVYWIGRRPEPAPFWLTEGRRIAARHWVQYDQQSPDTLWYSYPPFHLANSYEFRWRDHGRAGRSLLVPVRAQGTPS